MLGKLPVYILIAVDEIIGKTLLCGDTPLHIPEV